MRDKYKYCITLHFYQKGEKSRSEILGKKTKKFSMRSQESNDIQVGQKQHEAYE